LVPFAGFIRPLEGKRKSGEIDENWKRKEKWIKREKDKLTVWIFPDWSHQPEGQTWEGDPCPGPSIAGFASCFAGEQRRPLARIVWIPVHVEGIDQK
jgi:hypothetical protein